MKKKYTSSARKQKRTPLVEALSPRVLYSADPLGLANDISTLEITNVYENVLHENSGIFQSNTLNPVNDESLVSDPIHDQDKLRTEVVFVDSSVTNYQEIIDSLAASSGHNVSYTFYTIHTSESISDVDNALKNHSQLDAIHFITHGADANFRLGSSAINNSSVQDHSKSFEQWGAALATEGDILFYGCNLAETTDGQSLIAAIANATKADVGASENRTGHDSLNANWRLEYSIGKIDTDPDIIASALTGWESQLAFIIVSATDDVVNGDVSSVDNLISNDGGDGISLREAIIAANSDPATHDFIQLDAGTYTITTVSAGDDQFSDDFDITGPLTIQGNSPTTTVINNEVNDRIFSLNNAGEVTLSQLTIADGNSQTEGGAIRSTNTDLTLDTVIIENNTADQGGALYAYGGNTSANNVVFLNNSADLQGGGLFVGAGTFTGTSVTFSNNSSNSASDTGQGGGAFVGFQGTLDLSESQVINNRSNTGGGVYVNTGGALAATDTTFRSNSATTNGGAIENLAVTTIDRSLIDANIADRGAGIHDTGGTVTVADSTFSNNIAAEDGAAARTLDGKITIERSTVADNTVTGGRHVLDADVDGTLEISGTLIVRNDTPGNRPVVDSKVTSNGLNLADTTIINPHPTDQHSVANTGVSTILQNNGGFVDSYALLPGSPAIDAGANTVPGATLFDATGAVRNGIADIGAFEVPPPAISHTLPISAQTTEDTSLAFGSPIAIDHNRDSNIKLQVVIQVEHGVLDLQNTTNVETQNNNTSSVVIEGLRSEINNSLTSLKYTPDENYTGSDTLVIETALAADRELFYSFNSQNANDQSANDENLGTANHGMAIDNANFLSDQLNLDGVDDSILIESDFGVSDQLTFAAWVEFDSSISNTSPPMEIFSFYNTMGIRYNPASEQLWGAYFSDTDTFVTTANVNLLDGNRHHIAYTIDTVNNVQAVYIDGALFAQTAHNANLFLDTTDPTARIGGFSANNELNLTGSIDDVQFFSRTLSAEEIETIHGYNTEARISGSVPIEITPINDKPLLALTTSNTVFTENDIPATIAESVAISDVDDTEFESATITISSNFSPDDELQFTSQAGITGEFDPVNGVLELSGAATRADYETALQSITYQNNSDDPSDLTRSVSYTINDGDENSNTVTHNILFNAVNDSPELRDIEVLPVTYTENESFINITDTLTLSDSDNTRIESATVSISNNLSFGDELLFIDRPGISGSYNPVTGIMTLSGSASVADYQSALRNIKYGNFTDNPSTLTRTITFEVNDGNLISTELSRDIEVVAVNDAPLLSDIETAPITYIENDSPLNITSSLIVSDVDDTNIESAKVTISNNLAASEDELLFTDQNGIKGAYEPSTGVLTLTGSATVSDYQAALRTVSYNNTSNNPSTLTRSVSIEINDGIQPGNTLTRAIDIIPVNNAPSLENTDAFAFYIEGGPAIGVTNTVVITDVDNSSLESATISISSNFVAGEDELNFTDQLGITGSYNSSTGVMTLTGSAGIEDYQTALRSVTYSNSSSNPSTQLRTVSFDTSDGDLSSNTLSRFIQFITVNDAPVLSNIETAAATYTENDEPVPVTGEIIVSDVDNTNIEFAVISITGGFTPGEDRLVFTDQSGISGNYENANGALTLKGSATIADYQAAIRSVTYQNTSDNPSNPTRTVSIQVTDDFDTSNTVTRDINFTVANDAPRLATIEALPAFYTEGGSPVGITGNLSLTDVDDLSIDSATVTISNNFAIGEDELNFNNQSGITGSFDSDTGVLTLTGTATIADYQTALRTVAYSNSSSDPSILARTISFEISDGDLTSNVLSREVDFTAVNDAPLLSYIEPASALYTENDNPVNITEAIAISDVDDTYLESAVISINDNFIAGQDELIFFNQPDISGIYDSANGTLTLNGTATIADYQAAFQSIAYQNTSNNPSDLTRTVSFEIFDGNDASNIVTRLIEFTAVNDAPKLTTIEALPALYTEGGSPVGITGNLSITDVDDLTIDSATVSISNNFSIGEDELNFSNQSGITGSYDSSTGVMTLSGTATINEYQTAIRSIHYNNTSDNPSTLTRTLTIQINDGELASNRLSREIVISAVNDPPVLTSIETTPALFTENDAQLKITDSISVNDLDDELIEGATVSIISDLLSTEDVLVFDDQAGISGSYDTLNRILTLSGSATLAEYETALQSITYHNVSDNPIDATRTVTFEIYDNENTSNVLTRDIMFTAVNDAPTISNLEAIPAQFSEGEFPVSITENLDIADADNSVIEYAIISISGNFTAGEDELIFIDQPNITGSYSTTTGTMTLSGNATTAEYQSAIRSVFYNNTSENPSTLNRTVSIEVSDGNLASIPLFREIHVTAVNNTPTIRGLEESPLLFVENDEPINVTTEIQLQDADNLTLQSATIAISHNYSPSEDELIFVPSTPGNNTGISSFFDSANGTLLLTGPATQADFQDTIQSVLYINHSEAPSTAPRTISYTINDGTDAVTVTRELHVTSVNDAPVTRDSSVTLTEDTIAIIPFSDFPFTDSDDGNNSLAQVIVDTSNSRLITDNVARTITYTPEPNFNGTDSFTFQVQDDGGVDNNGADTSTTATLTVNVIPANDSPVTRDVTLPTVPEDSSPEGLTISSLVTPVFSDIDTGDTPTGIAITGNTELPENGSWQYALPGGPWNNVSNTPGTLTDTTALLLSADTLLRFLPEADFNGTPQPLLYKTLDSTYSGTYTTTAETVALSTTIATNNNSFSNTAEITTQVAAVNDAPIIADAELPAINEDTTLATPPRISDLFEDGYFDADNTPDLFGIAVTGNMATPDEGIWAYSPDSISWFNIDTVNEATALVLNNNTFIRFEPAANFNGSPTDLVVRPIDGIYTGSASGSNNPDHRVTVDSTTLGNQIGARHTISTAIISVNDAPLAMNVSLAGINEDDVNPDGELLRTLITPVVTDVDTNLDPEHTIVGIAIKENSTPATDGNWQYRNADALWQNIGVVSANNALLLDPSVSVRFLPQGDYFGTPDSLKAHIVDSSYTGSSAEPINVQSTGGSTPFSNEIELSTFVNSVNDAPAGSDATVDLLEDSQYTFSIENFGFTDPVESDAFSGITVKSLPQSGILTLSGIPVNVDDRINAADLTNLIYIPNINDSGQYEWEFVVIDNGGTTNNGIDQDQSRNTITLNVLPVNDAPAGNNSIVPAIGGTQISLLESDFGFKDPLDNHAINSVIIDAIPLNGTLLLNNNAVLAGQLISVADINAGLLTYEAAVNTAVADSTITFRVMDSGDTINGGQDTATSSNTLTFTVTPPPNTPPLSTDINIKVLEDSTHHFTADDFNFTDPQDEHEFESLLVLQIPEAGDLSLNGTTVEPGTLIPVSELPTLSYKPAPSENGQTYSFFSYKVTDNGTLIGGGSNTSVDASTITFDVTPVNDAPSASSTHIQIVETEILVLSLTEFGFADPIDEHELKSITIVTAPTSGTLLLNQSRVETGDTVSYSEIVNSQLHYQPAPVETATADQIAFTVTDDGGTSNGGVDTSQITNTISIAINADNTRPIGQDASLTITQNSVLTLNSDTFSYSDPTDNDQLAGIIISALPESGVLALNNTPVQDSDFISINSLDNNELTFTPDVNAVVDSNAQIGFLVVDSGSDQTGKHIAEFPSTLTISIEQSNDTIDNSIVDPETTPDENLDAGKFEYVVFTFTDLNDDLEVTVSHHQFEISESMLALNPYEITNNETEEALVLQPPGPEQNDAIVQDDLTVSITDSNEVFNIKQNDEAQGNTGSFSIPVPFGIFFEINNNAVELSATQADGSPLPTWIQFDPLTGEFRISGDNATKNQVVSIELFATDQDGSEASSVFDVNVRQTFAAALPATERTLDVPQTAAEVETVNETEMEVEEGAKRTTELSFEAPAPRPDENPSANNEDTDTIIEFETESIESIILDALNNEGFAVRNHNEFMLDIKEKYSGNVARVQQEIETLNAVSLKNLSQHADANIRKLQNSEPLSSAAIATSTTFTSSLSVGYLIWLLRSGTLLASMMASLPAWRTIDPLPILADLTGDNEDDIETLESMVESDDDEPGRLPKRQR